MKFIIFLLVLGVFLVPSAYGISAGTQYEPTQPNALVSYNNATNQISVSWDFDSLDADARCAIKGDFIFPKENAYSDVHTRITSFIPKYFSINTFPVILYSIDPPTIADPSAMVSQLIGNVGEEISCTGSFKIDIDDTLLNRGMPILTFYILNIDGELSMQDNMRIDEVSILYSPNSTLTRSYTNALCSEHIGNALYITSSGIHGNNGDNCDQYIKLQSKQFFDIGSQGNLSYGTHPESISLLTKVEIQSIVDKRNGGGCSGDCTDPTFFKNKAGKKIVNNGFEFNGNATDVINFHTPYDLITVNTNQTYNMKLKVYESNALKWIGVYFGVPEIGSPLDDAESEVIFYLNYDNDIEEIVTVDKHTLIDIVRSNMTMTSCGYTSSDCYELDFDFVFRDSLQNNVVGIQAVDMARNSATHYINDGIEAVGESMNEPLISTVAVGKAGVFYPQRSGLVELTLVDYKTDAWQDEYGYLWTDDDYKSFKIVSVIPVPIKEPDVMSSVMTRTNSHFSDMIQFEKDRAVLVFDGSKLLNEIGESFAYELPQSEEEYEKELTIKLEIEADRANHFIFDNW